MAKRGNRGSALVDIRDSGTFARAGGDDGEFAGVDARVGNVGPAGGGGFFACRREDFDVVHLVISYVKAVRW